MTTSILQNPAEAFVDKEVGIFARAVQSGSTITTQVALGNLDVTHTYLGALLVTGASFTIPGAPTRDALMVAVDGGTEEVAAYTPTTDAFQVAGTFTEILNRDLWENLLGTTFDGDAISVTGSVPNHVEIVLVLINEAGDMIGAVAPYAMPSVTAAVGAEVGGTNGVPQVQAQFSGDKHPSITDADGKKTKGFLILPAEVY